MVFELLPTFDIMIGLYEQPRSIERFKQYLKTLQGDSEGELMLPIGNFNPMAKKHMLDKLESLNEIDVEQIISQTLAELNSKVATLHGDRRIQVVPNVSDDLLGGWTNRYTSDYDS